VAAGDARYLAVRSEIPPRDGQAIRYLEAAAQDRRAEQDEYIQRYNATLSTIIRVRGGFLFMVPPMPRSVFTLELLLAVLPFMLIYYVRYRLGAYRIGVKSWTVDFWSPTAYLEPSRYMAEGMPLVHLLWGLMVATVPWILFVLFALSRRF